MAYTKTVWRNGASPAINAPNLNKIEQGILDAHNNPVFRKDSTETYGYDHLNLPSDKVHNLVYHNQSGKIIGHDTDDDWFYYYDKNVSSFTRTEVSDTQSFDITTIDQSTNRIYFVDFTQNTENIKIVVFYRTISSSGDLSATATTVGERTITWTTNNVYAKVCAVPLPGNRMAFTFGGTYLHVVNLDSTLSNVSFTTLGKSYQALTSTSTHLFMLLTNGTIEKRLISNFNLVSTKRFNDFLVGPVNFASSVDENKIVIFGRPYALNGYAHGKMCFVDTF